jgi:hypothetical protein
LLFLTGLLIFEAFEKLEGPACDVENLLNAFQEAFEKPECVLKTLKELSLWVI